MGAEFTIKALKQFARFAAGIGAGYSLSRDLDKLMVEPVKYSFAHGGSSDVNGAILLQGRVRINARPNLFSPAAGDNAAAAAQGENRYPEPALLLSRKDKQEVFDDGEQRLFVKRY
jgi:hypothetical protein